MARKNVSPQNHYEVQQLYAAGALKIACVGLQCVGFNTALNRTIMEQAAKCQANGRWRTGTWSTSAPPAPLLSTLSNESMLGNTGFGITHPHIPNETSFDFDASAPAAAAAASAAASVLDEVVPPTQGRASSMFNSM